jgi:hypothetical protein
MREKMNSLKKQSGMSMYLVMFLFVIAGGGSLLALKVIPHYLEYSAVKRAVITAAASEAGRAGTVSEIRKAFDRAANVDNIKVLNGNDLEIAKDGTETVVSAAWTAKIPLVANWTLVIEFATASNEKS